MRTFLRIIFTKRDVFSFERLGGHDPAVPSLSNISLNKILLLAFLLVEEPRFRDAFRPRVCMCRSSYHVLNC